MSTQMENQLVTVPFEWSGPDLVCSRQIELVLDPLQEYWPLPPKLVFYQLVRGGQFECNEKHYAHFLQILARGRICGRIAWAAIEDEIGEALHPGLGWEQLTLNLKLLQRGWEEIPYLSTNAHDLHIELWTDKTNLWRFFFRSALNYNITVRLVDYCFDPEKMADVLDFQAKRGLRTAVLLFQDSEGDRVAAAAQAVTAKLKQPQGVEFVDCTLTPQQWPFEFPSNPLSWRYGQPLPPVYEWDAVTPWELEALIGEQVRALRERYTMTRRAAPAKRPKRQKQA